MIFLDTNIILRYLTRDDKTKAAKCYDLFQRVKHGKVILATTIAIIAEVAYVLSSRSIYNYSHEEVRDRLLPILTLRGLKLPHKRLYQRALDLYATHPFLDFEDAVTVATMQKDSIQEVYSYDKDFDKIEAVRRIEP